MPTDTHNPLGLNGFAFVEFTSPNPDAMASQLEQFGFVKAARHPSSGAILYRQGDISLILNNGGGRAAEFRAEHGPSAAGMGLRVADAEQVYAHVLANGANPIDPSDTALPGARVIEGIGGSVLYLVDSDPFADWEETPGWRDAERRNSVGLRMLDHLTHNVRRGQMRVWSSYYHDLFGFEEQRYFDIKGQASGLFSQAMIAPDGAIRIPLNESQDDKSQIEEFLRLYNGEGIQHIAFSTDDIYHTVEALRARGVRLQDTVDTYYDLIESRVPGHGEDLERMKQNRILIDGSVGEEGLLLQIFTDNLFGPIFFEIIQRKGNESFGHGNFQALFESIELDQIRRGAIKVPA